MFTVKKLHNHIDNFLSDLKDKNIHVKKAILFGSYANGKVNENSDVNLAIWADEFKINNDNLENIKESVAKYNPISPKLYCSTENDDPFIEIIYKTGKVIS